MKGQCYPTEQLSALDRDRMFRLLNDNFLGASQLIVIADTKRPDGIKDSKPLQSIEEFSNYMIGAEGASDSVTIIDIVKRLARLYHDGDPRWGLIPDNPKEIGQLFYVFTNSSAPGGRHSSERCTSPSFWNMRTRRSCIPASSESATSFEVAPCRPSWRIASSPSIQRAEPSSLLKTNT